MKSEKLKRNFWVSAEIECMLDLIKEVNNCQGALSTSTTQYTFIQIANQMKKRGFPNKSPTQIRRKWFQMKSAYLCYKKGNVDRLFLIPEKFRNDIARFVESGEKIGRSNLSTISTGTPAVVQQTHEVSEEDTTPMDIFLNQIRKNNKMINSEFFKMEESLQQFEQKCQFIRDRNVNKLIDGY
ncbi:uncharacterized protein LOC6527976 isoform X2 [Drosophila yakuba]|uniref:Uncharacterized protein, isoform B n=1 Tax=Drosophila yakuba TaxID=7245 RepID=A0A0R1DSQ5_DROYA|nr:uncharacterized protein LOC6527976 isoform X2 [Drosophila yakuba]KRJ98003.1 uncharacterized protein Dyak_GE26339, isoform B [Drosophila yakuba]